MEEAGRRVAEHLSEAPEYRRARRLVAYAALPNELPLTAVVAHARADGKRTLFPRLIDAVEMVLARVDRIEHLRPGRYGVPEPSETEPGERLAEDVLVLVPGVAFDRRGGRLGRGRGIWDRALAARNGAVVFGVGFELQVVESLPWEEHDQPMDGLVTEAGVRRFSRT